MNFDFFTQPRGPEISISLFPDAAAKGIASGNALPTPLTAAIKGGVEGYKTGLAIQEKIQDIAIKEHQIEQQPLEDELDKQRLENAKRQAEAQDLELRKALRLEKDAQAFNDIFKSGDISAQIDAVTSGAYNELLSESPNLYNNSLKSIYVNPAIATINPVLQNQIGKFLKTSDTVNYWDRLAATQEQNFTKAKTELYTDPLTHELASRFPNSTPEQYPEKVQFVPAGKYQKDGDGNILLDPATRSWKLDPDWLESKDKNKGYFDVIDPTRNQILSASVPEASRKVYTNYPFQRNLQSGVFKNNDLAQADSSERESTEKESQITVEAPFTSEKGSAPTEDIGATKKDFVTQSIVDSFNLSAGVSSKITEPLDSFQRMLSRYVSDPTFRASPDSIKHVINTFDTFSKTLTNSEFDSTPALKEQYTAEKVTKYNDALRVMASVSGGYGSFGAAKVGESALLTEDMIKPFLIETPKDLYYIQRREILGKQMDDVLRKLSERIRLKENLPLRAQAANKATIDFLTSVKNGRYRAK